MIPKSLLNRVTAVLLPASFFFGVTTASSFAQSQPKTEIGDPPPVGELLRQSPSQPASQPPRIKGTSCVDVEIGGERSFSCLNEQLKRDADSAGKVPNVPPIDAGSPNVKTGTVSKEAVHQQFGKNFGVSAVPYRPVQTYGTGSIGPKH